jgi:hypothetical protein
VIGENVSANIGRKVVAALEARIRIIQIEPLEVPIPIDLDVPHLLLCQSIWLRKALSTSIALKWLSCAKLDEDLEPTLTSTRTCSCRSERCNAQLQQKLEENRCENMILCIVGTEIVLRLLLLSTLLTKPLSVVVVVEEQSSSPPPFINRS